MEVSRPSNQSHSTDVAKKLERNKKMNCPLGVILMITSYVDF